MVWQQQEITKTKHTGFPNWKAFNIQVMDNHRILIIDDDKDLLESLEYLFSKKGYGVITANSGKSGIKIFKENEIDVVITDMKMPKIDGLAVIKELKNVNSDIPIIVFTGYATIDNTIQSLNMGVFDFLTKPCDNETLLNMVRKAIENTKYLKN